MSTPRKLCLWHLTTFTDDLTLAGGEVLPAGTEVLLVPQTTAHSVVVENGKTLGELWPQLATAIAGFSAELIRYADRQTKMEAQQARLEAWARQNGYTGA